MFARASHALSKARTEISATCFISGICPNGKSEAMSRPTRANDFQIALRVLSIPRKASAEIAKFVKDPQFGEQLKGLGLDLVGSTRAELDAFRREQTKQIADIVKAAGVTAK